MSDSNIVKKAHLGIVIVLTFVAVCGVLLFLLTCYAFYQYNKDKDAIPEKRRPSRARLYLSFFAILFDTIAIVNFAIAKFLIPSYYWIGTPNIIISHAWATGGALGYLLFLRLIYDIFNNTNIAPSRIIYVVCLLLIFVYFVAENTVGIFTILITINTMSAEIAYSYISPCLTTATICDFCISAILMITFATKLMKITAYTASPDDLTRLTIDQTLGQTQKEFVYSVTKQTILTLTETTSTQILFICSIIVSLINAAYNSGDFTLNLASDVEYVLSAIPILCNASAIFLTLEFNIMYYQRICHCCHTCCNDCCLNITKKTIERERHLQTVDILDRNSMAKSNDYTKSGMNTDLLPELSEHLLLTD